MKHIFCGLIVCCSTLSIYLAYIAKLTEIDLYTGLDNDTNLAIQNESIQQSSDNETHSLFKYVDLQSMNGGPKVILLWNFNEIPMKKVINCGDCTCLITSDTTAYNISSAVVAYSNQIIQELRRMKKRKDEHLLPTYHPNNQVWIFRNLESPISLMHSLQPLSKLSNLLNYLDFRFNWTWGYQRNCDIWEPYGYFNGTHAKYRNITIDISDNRKTIENINFAANKSKLVFWAVSNCAPWSRRDVYVEKLIEYIPVDIFGECGEF
ncbi:unnamed protein product, partial [Owenia fusiformis]